MKGTFTWRFEEAVLSDCFDAVRDKVDAMLVIVKAMKLMLVWPTHNEPEPPKCGIVLAVGSLCRLFIIKPDKVVSLAFPFTLRIDGDEIGFSGLGGIQINSMRTAQIESLLVDLKASNGLLEVLGVPDLYAEEEDGGGAEIAVLVRDLLLSDDGYLRYDRDTVRANGVIHPELHIDAFYTNRASVKFGLYESLDHRSFRQILESEGGCYFVARHRED